MAAELTDDYREWAHSPMTYIDDLETAARLTLRLKRFERDLEAYIHELRTTQTLAGDLMEKRVARCRELADAALHIEAALRLITMVMP